MALRLCYLVTCRIFGLPGSRRRTALDKDIELMVLRHEVRVLKRQLHGRVRYRPTDRAMLAALSRLLPRWRWGCFLVTPETLLRCTGSSRVASGSDGEPREVLDVPRSAMSSLSSSSDRTLARLSRHPRWMRARQGLFLPTCELNALVRRFRPWTRLRCRLGGPAAPWPGWRCAGSRA